MATGFGFDPLFLAHDTGQHPENAGRVQAIVQRLTHTDQMARLTPLTRRLATAEELGWVHTPAHQERVRQASLQHRAYLDTPDCVVSPHTYDAALLAAGMAVQAVEDVQAGRLNNAFVACRPPGHHAERDQSMGFCFFNNIAVAAEYLVQRVGLTRVLIFDFDVHHGNGTQHTFESRADVFYASVHQHPATQYPGTGYAEEQGRGPGLGYTLNVPLLPGAGDEAYLQALHQVLLPAFQAFRPQFVLLSAGFDAHQNDPLGGMALSTQGFNAITQAMLALAHQFAQGKLVSLLEGGYDKESLAECVSAHMELLGQADAS